MCTYTFQYLQHGFSQTAVFWAAVYYIDRKDSFWAAVYYIDGFWTAY